MTKKECRILLRQLAEQFAGIAAETKAEYDKVVNLKSIAQRTLTHMLSIEARSRRMQAAILKEVKKLEKVKDSSDGSKSGDVGSV